MCEQDVPLGRNCQGMLYLKTVLDSSVSSNLYQCLKSLKLNKKIYKTLMLRLGKSVSFMHALDGGVSAETLQGASTDQCRHMLTSCHDLPWPHFRNLTKMF